MREDSKRNLVPQRILNPDGTYKTIFHKKKWPIISRKQVWDLQNKSPKPKSKTQQLKQTA